jgi:hypothetical protein
MFLHWLLVISFRLQRSFIALLVFRGKRRGWHDGYVALHLYFALISTNRSKQYHESTDYS